MKVQGPNQNGGNTMGEPFSLGCTRQGLGPRENDNPVPGRERYCALRETDASNTSQTSRARRSRVAEILTRFIARQCKALLLPWEMHKGGVGAPWWT